MLKRVCDAWQDQNDKCCLPRNRINLVASVLHGVTDSAAIDVLLSALEVNPCLNQDSPGPCYFVYLTTPEEYARILVVASLASRQTLMQCVQFINERLAVNMSYVTTVRCLDADDRARNRVCWPCEKLRYFMRSNEQTVVFKKAKFDPHVREVIEHNLLTRHLDIAESTPDDGDHPLVIVTNSCENKLSLAGHDAIRRLDKLLTRRPNQITSLATEGEYEASRSVRKYPRGETTPIYPFGSADRTTLMIATPLLATEEYFSWAKDIAPRSMDVSDVHDDIGRTGNFDGGNHKVGEPWEEDATKSADEVAFSHECVDPDGTRTNAVPTLVGQNVSMETCSPTQAVELTECHDGSTAREQSNCAEMHGNGDGENADGSDDSDDGVVILGTSLALAHRVPLAHWTTLLQCDVVPVVGDGYCLYRAYLTATSADANAEVGHRVLKLKNKVMKIALKCLDAEVSTGELNPKAEAKNLKLGVSETATEQELVAAIRRHYKAVLNRKFLVPVPESHWGRPAQIRALARIAQAPIYVISEFNSSWDVQLYTFQSQAPCGHVEALSPKEAEQRFREMLATDKTPIVFVHSHSKAHYDALFPSNRMHKRRRRQ